MLKEANVFTQYSKAEVFDHYLRLGVPRSHAIWRAYEVSELPIGLLENPILDLGCGHGELASVLSKNATQPFFTTGVDISPQELEKAQKTGMYQNVVQADARALPFSDGTFRTVFAFSVMEHIPDVATAFHEAMRVLSPGGKFILTVPLKDIESAFFYPKLFQKLGLHTLSNWYITTLQNALKHHNMWSQEEWESLAQENGARIQTSRRIIPEDIVQEWDRFMPFAATMKIMKLPPLPGRVERLTRRFNDRLHSSGNCTNLLLVLEKP